MNHNTYRLQLSYVLNGNAESFPVEVKSSNPEAAQVSVVNSLLGMFQNVTKIQTQVLS